MSYENMHRVREASKLYLSYYRNASMLIQLSAKADVSEEDIDKAERRYETNISGSNQHVHTYWDFIIEDAISDAQARGIEIDYPAFTVPESA